MNMTQSLTSAFCAGALCLTLCPTLHSQEAGANPATAQTTEAGPTEGIRENSGKLAAAFNQGDAQAVAEMILPSGELIDETGRVYQGREEIQGLLTGLFEQYPGVQLTVNRESIRPLGPAIFEEGTRVLTTADGSTSAQFRYIDLWVQTASGWMLASHREFADEPTPTPRDLLEPIAWLAGDWVNQGADGSVAIQFKWSEDQNFLLGEFKMTDAAGEERKSTQRIGWDPRAGHIRSWLFDADGGFSEGVWSVVEDGIVIKSTSVNPDGTDASATLKLTPSGDDQFLFSGTDRIIGGAREPDFELTITRSPPQPLTK